MSAPEPQPTCIYCNLARDMHFLTGDNACAVKVSGLEGVRTVFTPGPSYNDLRSALLEARNALRRAYSFVEDEGGDVGDLLSQLRAAGERVSVALGPEVPR